jgi:fatty acid desaturase
VTSRRASQGSSGSLIQAEANASDRLKPVLLTGKGRAEQYWDIPLFEDEDWTWSKGAFRTSDRPYGVVLDFMHHRIGSTHVAHHIDARIPHYHAAKATCALREHFSNLYRHDPTPIPKALWRFALH